MANTIKNTATPMKERLKGFGQIAIAGIILALLVGVAFVVVNAQGDDNDAKPVKEPNIKVVSVDNATNDDCIKENLLVYEDGKWTEKEIIYPWSNCFDLKNSEKFDGFAYENVEKPDVDELKKEAKERVFSILMDVGLPGENENENKIDKTLSSPLDSFISVMNKQKIADKIVNKMDEKEIFRFVFREVIVEDVVKKIENLDSYGGLAIDEYRGLIFVYLNDDKDKKKIKEILKPHINKGANVVFLKGKYTSSELKEWNERINENKPANITIKTLGFSVFLNKIIIGVPEANNETLKKVSNYLTKINIPLEDVYIEESDIKELSRTDKIRPLIGGLQIKGDNCEGCTLGFVAKRNGVKGFITAGHCSLGYNNFCQPEPFGSACNSYNSNYIGKTTITTCKKSNSYADVAWIPTSQSICPTIYKDSGFNYVVAGKRANGGDNGESVCKSGAKTGETCGTIVGISSTVTDSCGTFDQVNAKMRNDEGDSGAPIFKKLFTWCFYGSCWTYVYIYGVLSTGGWSTNWNSYITGYGSIENIEKDIGSLEVNQGSCF